MKVLLDGQEIEIETEIEKGEIELDKIVEDGIDTEDTIEITEEMLNKIKEESDYV